MNARRSAISLSLMGGLLVLGPAATAWADGPATPAPAASATSSPAPDDVTSSPAPDAPGATTDPADVPTDAPSDSSTDEPVDATAGVPTDERPDDATTTGDPETTVPIGSAVDPILFQNAVPEGAVAKGGRRELPFAGAPVGLLSLAGLALLAAGGATLLIGRLRTSPPDLAS